MICIAIHEIYSRVSRESSSVYGVVVMDFRIKHVLDIRKVWYTYLLEETISLNLPYDS